MTTTPNGKNRDEVPLRIELSNQQTRPIDDGPLLKAARAIVSDSDFIDVTLSIAIVDDPTMHELNRRFLDHDCPTDVLSFPLERDQQTGTLEGEIIVSADTAFASAQDYGWEYENELLLYVIHGVLHLVGYDDKSDDSRVQMRAAETKYLSQLGIERS